VQPGGNDKEVVALKWGSSYWRYLLCLRSPEFGAPWTDSKGKQVRYVNHQRGWHIGYTAARVCAGEIPEGWTLPDFNDELWVRAKGGFREGSSWYDQSVRVACVRGRFAVRDPSLVKGLHLSIKYMGGVAVYLNGKEIARQHLPAGPLSAETMAESYPDEAYEWGIPLNRHNYPAEISEWQAPSPKAERIRTLDVQLDPKLLARGQNLLAFALHRAGYGPPAAKWNYEAMNGYHNTPWPHFAVLDLTLLISPPEAFDQPLPPGELHVWTEDIHRPIVNRDLPDWAMQAPVLRIVGARNGAYSAQAVMWARQDLSPIQVEVGDLIPTRGTDKIPASAVQIRFGVGIPLDDIREERFGRHLRYYTRLANGVLEAYGFGTGFRFKNMEERARPSEAIQAEARSILLYDGLTASAPSLISAGSSLPIWVTIRIPMDCQPGFYQGTILIKAGEQERKVPLRVYVVDWTLPDPVQFDPFVGFQQAIWGSCARYQCKPWSEEHWDKLERSSRLLGEVGNDLAILPLVVGGEAANEESLVPWVKKGSSYEYDWHNCDRYLQLVAKHWGTNVAVVAEICWVPRTERGWIVRADGVTVVEDGQRQKMSLPPFGSAEWADVFLPFAKKVAERVRGMGFRSLYWGWFYDGLPDNLNAGAEALWSEVPDVGWARASHNGFRNQPFPKGNSAANLDIRIRGFRECFARSGEPVSQMGWKNQGNILFPREASQIQAIAGIESPMALRWLAENCLVNAAAGFGRLGADFWPPFKFSNWYHPFANYILWHGPDGAESTVRFEALREGLQEAQVKIELEKAGKDSVEPASSVLMNRLMCIGALPTGSDSEPLCAYYGGWLQRSWDLYVAAAEVFGGNVPSAENHRLFWGHVR
ncbi:MAG: glycoside hydrolase domain-containing protein, partial [Kiritimatiellia bacterium]